MTDSVDTPVLSNKNKLRIMQAALGAFSRISLAEIERDLERIESLDDSLEGIYLVAYWLEYIDTLFNREKPDKTTDQDAQLRLILQRFGDDLGQPSAQIKVDVAKRLDWMKRRIAKDFERDFRYALDLHGVTSPIEQIFLMEWKYHRAEERLGVKRSVETSRGEYTVDFSVRRRDTRDAIVLIEIDGHDFHEKTRAQATSDKRRERAIVQTGTIVLRFSASEVFREPRACIEEVVAFIESRQA